MSSLVQDKQNVAMWFVPKLDTLTDSMDTRVTSETRALEAVPRFRGSIERRVSIRLTSASDKSLKVSRRQPS